MGVKQFIFFIFTLIFCISLNSQTTTIKGVVTTTSGVPLSGVLVDIIETNTAVVTNANGNYEFNNIQINDLNINFSLYGYKSKNIFFKPKKDNQNILNVSIEHQDEILEEVILVDKSKTQRQREAPVKIEVIDIKELQRRAISLPQILKQVSGVNIRQNGAVGGSTIINLNGMQGDDIRFFRDGIPLDYLGKAFNLSFLPTDQLKNIEIYKGVLPTALGADALGGAVNLISNDYRNNGLTASYSFGAFNSHQFNVNGYYKIPKTKLFIGLSSYYVTSDNDYKILVDIPDEETAVLQEEHVNRFHSAAKSTFAEFKTGIKHTKIADLLELGIAFSDMHSDRQSDIWMRQVYGEVTYSENAAIFNTHYIKKLGKLNIDIFGAYSKISSLYDDTPENYYNWYGEATPYETENHSGESDDESQSYESLNFKNTVGRINLTYKLNKSHQFNFNHNYTNTKRTGSNPFQIEENGIDFLNTPSKYTKNVTGLGFTSKFFNGKISNVLTLKRFGINGSAVTPTIVDYGEIKSLSNASYGIGNSIKYKINNHQFIRVSYENSTRIPNMLEYFGDSESDILGNTALKPERSNNLNLGFYTHLNEVKTLWFDFNSFYRFIENNVILQAYSLYQSQYKNTDDTQILGAEFTLKSNPIPQLNYNVSLTYQNIRRKNIENSGDILLTDSRRPNIPYFFGSFGINYKLKREILRGSFEFYGNYNFTEQYLLNAIPKSEEPSLFGNANSESNLIPTQNLINLGLTYKVKKLPLWVNLETNNVFNAEIYDGFRVQKPGRNFNIKLRYSINN
ncbi:TonB-dependent receptor [Flavivirga jejuensis]|uniref:TonB-dependent receptor n=1 Tax=Flavivirga jejuensis TaxID=870487 RepID=A0ABT8WSI1_9FLAO|nr:TonB-dependent receptor [Flavivirga jejuensis]MDO5976128.1 TonB-dependent receptor [Flavivirga jejuensis]